MTAHATRLRGAHLGERGADSRPARWRLRHNTGLLPQLENRSRSIGCQALEPVKACRFLPARAFHEEEGVSILMTRVSMRMPN